MIYNRIIAIFFLGMFSMLSQSVKAVPDTVTMGSGYGSDVFYSLENGTISTVAREVWDLAFSAKVFSASILINDGSGSELYTWGNGDTSGWNAVDTIGMGSWNVLYNDPDDWENGAFVRNAKGHPDYGWGIYNAITHDVVGDSLYILKRADGALFKIWIKRKTFLGAAPVWVFRYAMLDGSAQQEITLDGTNYTGKNFIYFSLSAGLPIDREPLASNWDIMFTKYMAIHPVGNTPYMVTGVLSNYNTGANKFTGVPRSFVSWDQQPFDPGRSVIGYDWKTFDMGTFTYIVDDSTVFFVNTQSGDVYKLYFTAFAGSSSGNIFLFREKMSTAGVSSSTAGQIEILLYPNPASDYASVRMDLTLDKHAVVQLLDIQGRSIRQYLLSGKGDQTEQLISLEGLSSGLYLVSIMVDGQRTARKLMIN